MTALLGWHYLHARQFDRARETLERAVAMDSAAWRPHFDLALLELAAGQLPAAEQHLRIPLAVVSAAGRDPGGPGAAVRGLRPG